MVLVVLLALLSAFGFAFGSVVQQRATRNADAAHANDPVEADHVTSRLPVVGLIRTLGHSKLWFFGWCVNTSGFGIQAAALHFGSIALVQPLGVTQLLFTIALVAIWSKKWPLRRDWFFAVLICAGVALFLTVRGPIAQDDPGDRAKILLACVGEHVVDLNHRIRMAHLRPQEGPPMRVQPRDPEQFVQLWLEDRAQRAQAYRAAQVPPPPPKARGFRAMLSRLAGRAVS